jgi:K+-sensing histidine kinase KdpD
VPDDVGAPTAPRVRTQASWWEAAAYGVGLPVAAALLLELASTPLDLRPAAVLLLAVLIAALVGQQRAGGVAGVTAIVLVWFQFTEPRFSFRVTTWSPPAACWCSPSACCWWS